MSLDRTKSKSGIKQWLFMALSFGLSMGAFFSLQHDNWGIGMLMGAISGVCFATAMSWFTGRQSKNLSSNIPNFGNEGIIFEGPANHFKGAEGVGGYLWLTSQQLFFRSHKVNIQNHELRLPLLDITGVDTTKTLGIISNGLTIRLDSQVKERFVVNQNQMWSDVILQAKATIDPIQ